ncbi:MAG: 16S rRNA (guanine(527)-N(7))-methyltransferase RsmG [Acidobacteria bacterium]|nr:16S rRNA (guanine(527)-N(7))-methyltransferase RsmG [Acidobacteriota bacterium]
MSFAAELAALLPQDLPNRANVIEKAARHLEMIVEINKVMNLTRITDPREAAIKHVLDSLLPWRLFENAKGIADAGTGPGFPGIPLAITFPQAKFTLLDATQKKARFVESVVTALDLPNVEVVPQRAEEWLQKHKPSIVTGRAVAPLVKAIPLFAPAFKSGARVLLYKGPDAESEIAEATPEARKRRLRLKIVYRYELPDTLGVRTLVEIVRA